VRPALGTGRRVEGFLLLTQEGNKTLLSSAPDTDPTHTDDYCPGNRNLRSGKRDQTPPDAVGRRSRCRVPEWLLPDTAVFSNCDGDSSMHFDCQQGKCKEICRASLCPCGLYVEPSRCVQLYGPRFPPFQEALLRNWVTGLAYYFELHRQPVNRGQGAVGSPKLDGFRSTLQHRFTTSWSCVRD